MEEENAMEKVSVIIPSYNRFQYLQNAVQSVRDQTYPNIEIIIVNDCSTEQAYYDHDFGSGVTMIHLDENSKKTFGFACPGGYQRNFGIDVASGKYIAFLDDDDSWFPNKIEVQVAAMKASGCKMSCTEGLFGQGVYDKTKQYPNYNSEYHYNILLQIYSQSGKLANGFPDIWDLSFFQVHNCCICSSVVIEKEMIDKVGKFVVARRSEDYEYWLRVARLTNCVYVKEPCMYYDDGHGSGQKY